MAQRDRWSGTASDFLRVADKLRQDEILIRRPDWPRNPHALAGRLRRAQTSLRAVGIDITFQREGRAGSRIIKMCTATDSTVSTGSIAGPNGTRSADRMSAS